jgi:hypothetical protein
MDRREPDHGVPYYGTAFDNAYAIAIAAFIFYIQNIPFF